MKLKTIKDIIQFWEHNHYTQSVCVGALLEYFKHNTDLEYSRWSTLESVLNSVIDSQPIGEDLVIESIAIIEELITDKNELIGISCILSGEYLTIREETLINILQYYNWKITCPKNIFINWFYRLNGITDYYDKAVINFKHTKYNALARLLGVVVACMFIPYLFIALICFMQRDFLGSINAVILTCLFLGVFMASILAVAVLTYKLNIMVLLRATLGFKQYEW